MQKEALLLVLIARSTLLIMLPTPKPLHCPASHSSPFSLPCPVLAPMHRRCLCYP